MKLKYKIRHAGAGMLVLFSVSAVAITPVSKGHEPKSQPISSMTNGFIERGGSVTAIDMTKRIIGVDRTNYSFSPTTTPITYRESGRAASAENLRQGTRVEFVTRMQSAQPEEIVSIQIVSNPPK